MRRALDIVVVLAAIGGAVVWWRGFPKETSPPVPGPEAPAAADEVPVGPTPASIEVVVAPVYEETDPSPGSDEYLTRILEEDRLREESHRLAQEQDRTEREAQAEQDRRDRERREAFEKLESQRNQRISEARERGERAESSRAAYEALREHRRNCAMTTKNGSFRAYGCEGINERVRKAEAEMKNARNRRY